MCRALLQPGISQDCCGMQPLSILPSNTSILPMPSPGPSVWMALPYTPAFALPRLRKHNAIWSTPETLSMPRLKPTISPPSLGPHLMHHSRTTSCPERVGNSSISQLAGCIEDFSTCASVRATRSACSAFPEDAWPFLAGEDCAECGGTHVPQPCESTIPFNISGSECAQTPEWMFLPSR